MAAIMSAPPPLPARGVRPEPPSVRTLPRTRQSPSNSNPSKTTRSLERQIIPSFSQGYDDSLPPPPPPTYTIPRRASRNPHDDLPPPPEEWQVSSEPSHFGYDLHSRGASSPNLQSLDDPPPIPPRRGATVHSAHGVGTTQSNRSLRKKENHFDLERRFYFHKLNDLPPPDPFSGKPKKYASKYDTHQS